MTGTAKPADVRFYFDADVLGVAKIVAGLRPDVTFPGDLGGTVHRRTRQACPVASPDVADTEWIPIVANEGWLIVTRDNRIQEHRAEIQAVVEHSAKMIALGGREARNTWEQLEIVFGQWRQIEKLSNENGPFIWVANRSGLRAVRLPDD